ncbi:hypothetical protein QVD17_06337 [Tagetes erecta]|uniref:Uncharacterized protein n=1 Tax=Tagetes erecta TaxID=13708 RepID=A0AAD8PBQ6_TARER|nr:hypothetical protein QVD17_06337 [Tagetes erecta]
MYCNILILSIFIIGIIFRNDTVFNDEDRHKGSIFYFTLRGVVGRCPLGLSEIILSSVAGEKKGQYLEILRGLSSTPCHHHERVFELECQAEECNCLIALSDLYGGGSGRDEEDKFPSRHHLTGGGVLLVSFLPRPLTPQPLPRGHGISFSVTSSSRPSSSLSHLVHSLLPY